MKAGVRQKGSVSDASSSARQDASCLRHTCIRAALDVASCAERAVAKPSVAAAACLVPTRDMAADLTSDQAHMSIDIARRSNSSHAAYP